MQDQIKIALLFFLVVVKHYGDSEALPLSHSQTRGITKNGTLRFLEKFGYLPKQLQISGALLQNHDIREAVKSYQAVMGLPQTGVMDDVTKKEMEKPRCGVSDVKAIQKEKSGHRQRTYVLTGEKWNKNELTYRITKYTPDLSQSMVDDTVATAFKIWQDVSSLKFTKLISGTPDIEIVFAAGAHGDGEPFDGPSGVLAHAAIPQDGDAHFDNAEQWTINTSDGINLLQVAVHEFGHSLGLDHSSVESAIMYASYNGYVPNFSLNQDDINGIQAMYPVDGQTPSPPVTTVSPGDGDEGDGSGGEEMFEIE